MSEREQTPEQRDGRPERTVRIVDLVFAGEPGGRVRRLAVGGACVVALYACAILVVGRFGRSGASVCAEMAARVHDAIAAERAVDVTPPPPPPPGGDTTHAARRGAGHPRARPHGRRTPRTGRAGTGRTDRRRLDVAARLHRLGVRRRLRAVVRRRHHHQHRDQSQADQRSRRPERHRRRRARSRARPVSLDQAAWNCPWPAEADARQVDQETVVIRVAVGVDGRADRVDVLQDPGFGFGTAARQCALATRFGAARNPAGDPIAALSPPIRVHFFR